MARSTNREGKALAAVPNIDRERLTADLLELAAVGATAAGGNTRLYATPEYAAAQDWLRARLAEIGLTVSADAAGNIFGHYRPAGAPVGEPSVYLGSHLDTVPNGGRYDGALGVTAALAAARAVSAAGAARPFTVVCWADEEGARFGAGLFGSRAATGDVSAEELTASCDAAGVTRAEAMRLAGLDPTAALTATLPAGSVRNYLELHIEQGANLTQRGADIGVVEGIVGIVRQEVTFSGQANHAGTTPMHLRHDALRGAARLIQAVPAIIARSGSGRSVGTVGQISVRPGAANVIPGEAALTVELRDLSGEVLTALAAGVEQAAREAATAEGLRVNLTVKDLARPAMLDEGLRTHIAELCRARGYSAVSLPSGAGHDAQSLAPLAPSAMIFVPSEGGISHSPDEYTSPEDCGNGAQVLADLLASLVATATHSPAQTPSV